MQCSEIRLRLWLERPTNCAFAMVLARCMTLPDMPAFHEPLAEVDE